MSGIYALMLITMSIVDSIIRKKVLVDDIVLRKSAVFKWHILIAVVCFILIIVLFLILDFTKPQPLITFIMFLSFCTAALMEWKFNRETDCHILSIADAAVALLFTVILLVLRIF